MNIQKANKRYTDIFNDIYTLLKKQETPKIFEARESAFERFQKKGIPDNKDENYKRANFEEICKSDYDFDYDPGQPNVDIKQFFHCSVEEMDSHVILLSNGNYYTGNRLDESLPESLIICGFNQAKQKYPHIVEKYFDKQSRQLNDPIIDLNTMLANDGLFIYVPENVVVEKTIQLVNLTHGFGNKNIFKRNLFIVDKNASLKLIICDHTLNNSNNFVVDVTEAYTLENANLQYYTLQNEPNRSAVVNSLLAHQQRYSVFNSLALSLHGGMIRNNIHVKLADENAEANLAGLFLTDRNQIIDNYIFIDHIKPNCVSNQLYKGILDESARGSFAGKILVRKDAQKTAAYQTNNNLCLTPEARMFTKPQLEIYADDVKCSHGATVGQLDDNALFYLQSRGIDQKEAKLMLMFAFANDVIRNINIKPLRERISGLVNARLRGEFSDCDHCLLNCSGENVLMKA